jgi:hypothetical protein
LPLPVRQSGPAATAKRRYRPIVPIHVIAPPLPPPLDACIDSAADDTVFPPHWAARPGIDLAAAPHGQA